MTTLILGKFCIRVDLMRKKYKLTMPRNSILSKYLVEGTIGSLRIILMASNTTNQGFIMVLVLIFACFQIAISGDADIVSDFIVPPNLTKVDGRLFTFTALRSLVGVKPPTSFTASKVSMPEFPALNGQSVSYAFLQYPAGTLNPPHTYPPSAELLFLVDGCLEVGLVDTANKLFTQTLEAGDMFVFPKGLVHYQYNNDPKNLAVAVSAFGSASAGIVSIPSTLFTTGVDSGILAKAFKTDVAAIEKIKAGFA